VIKLPQLNTEIIFFLGVFLSVKPKFGGDGGDRTDAVNPLYKRFIVNRK